MLTTSLVLGILSIVFAFVGFFAFAVFFCPVAIVLGLIGLVLAIVGKQNAGESKGKAKAGLVTSIVGLSMGGLYLLLWIILIACGIIGF